ncbi:MAG: hypothetical protein L6U16_09950 [Porphyromonadaceae bacterium]|nr:MAG: hypothetical protein L6U16_09950 [Porphyromonadaceae bacterium]
MANGIIPNVIRRDGGCAELVQFNYSEAAITNEQKASTKPEDLKACLEAGVIPNAYKGVLTDVRTAEVKEYASDVADSVVLQMTPEQMRSKALEGYFCEGCRTQSCLLSPRRDPEAEVNQEKRHDTILQQARMQEMQV